MKLVAIVLLVAFTTSCTSIHYVKPNHWKDLDGYRPDKRGVSQKLKDATKKKKTRPKNKVRDKHGHLVTVSEKSPVVLRLKNGNKVERNYRAIDVPDAFIGFPVTGSKVVVQRSQIDRLGIRKFDAIKTTVLVVVIVLVSGIVLGTIVCASGDCSGDGDSDTFD